MVRVLCGLVGLLFMSGCSFIIKPTATPVPTLAPTVAPVVSGDWVEIAAGVWTRTLEVAPPYSQSAFDMPIVKIDPSQVRLRVHYEPTQWFTLPEWAAMLNNPLVVINGSFFTEDGYAVGLVVTEGEYFGNSLDGFGGMLQVENDTLRLRSLVREPYQGEVYDQVVQGFPMLIHPGGEPARTGDGFDDPARRTLIAQDQAGYLYLMVTPDPFDQLTLRNAQQWLLESELNFDSAFGLDGGKSSGLRIAASNYEKLYPSIDPVAVVIAVYPR